MTRMINRATVIGSGVMGAAIAAHLANAGIPAYLLDMVPGELTEKEKAQGLTLDDPAVRNRIVNEGWARCQSAKPANLFTPDLAARVTTGNLEDNMAWVGEADWIIEVIVERLDVKRQLMARIEAVRKPGSIVSTNTSGLPIRAICEGRSDEFRAHFLGMHFFNPPRYLKLLEIIPHAGTDPHVVAFMKSFAERALGKGVVVCRDTPNFIANRLLALGGMYAMSYALDNGYTVEEVDALTGPLVGRPATATFRLNDLIGVDVVALVGDHLYPALPDDPQREVLRHAKSAAVMKAMIERKWLGNKSGQGFYKRVDTPEGRQFWTLDFETLEYKPPEKPRFESVEKHEKVEEVGERIKRLCGEADRAGRYLWATTAFTLNYAASVAPEIAEDLAAIDNAARWGFGHELGPFEIWDALGVAEAAARMEAEGMAVTPWVKEMLAAGHMSFYKRECGQLSVYDPARKAHVPIPPKPRALQVREIKSRKGSVIAANPSASLIDMGDGALLVEFHSKANALDQDISDMLARAREALEKDWIGLVIGNQGRHFCAGANIAMMATAAQDKQWDAIETLLRNGQNRLMALRHSPKPVVTAPFGMVLGGGAEVMMGASAICAAAESYIGQAEAGVGLIPAAGGCKELLRRVVSPVVKSAANVELPFLQKVFELVAMAKISGSAEEARQWGFLTPCDRIVMNGDHLLAQAKRMALEMAEDYRPPLPGKDIWAMGASGLALLELAVYSFREAGYITEHDVVVARKAAHVLCGGKLSRAQWVDAQYILDLEREAFLSLLGEPKTIDRIWHMLKTGKPLRN